MSGRFAAVAIAVLAAAGAILAACYDVPEPDCGFICGSAGECPSHYTCADDHYCHRNGAPVDLTCAAVRDADVTDAAADAAVDAMPDAPDAAE